MVLNNNDFVGFGDNLCRSYGEDIQCCVTEFHQGVCFYSLVKFHNEIAQYLMKQQCYLCVHETYKKENKFENSGNKIVYNIPFMCVYLLL